MSISLIEFSVENFKIFQKKASLSLFASKSSSTFEVKRHNLLRTTLVYGPNASGKSTLFNAAAVVKNLVINSANMSLDGVLPYEPFLLSSVKDKPVFFEIVFALNSKVFKYSFSILKNLVITENLIEVLTTGVEKVYLERKKQDIKLFYDFKNSRDVADVKTRDNVLFLSAASQWNNQLALNIVNSFKELSIVSGVEADKYKTYTMKLFENDKISKKKILKFLKQADFCIEDGVVEKVKISEEIRGRMMKYMKSVPDQVSTVNFSHAKFNSKGEKVGVEKWNYGNESKGTQQFFDILGPIINALDNGKVLFIDEFDNSIHPLLTKFIIDLFEKHNPNNAQLVVATHDVSILSYKELRKEQIWFTQKDKYGSASIFSLSEFKIRNDVEFSKKYLEGRFGALPFTNFED